MTKFSDVFPEYYALYRGQATNIPVWPSPEYKVGIQLANAAIKIWDRADGILWRELVTSLSAQKIITPAYINTLSGVSTAAPDNMRKPPAWVRFTLPNGSVSKVKVSLPENASGIETTRESGKVWFVGGASTGFTMQVDATLFNTINGATFDYVYIKKPTLLSATADPKDTVIDMSDPTFLVQKMLAFRFQNSRNGFGYKTADKDATDSLANMKLENYSGTYGDTESSVADGGWGTSQDSFGAMEL